MARRAAASPSQRAPLERQFYGTRVQVELAELIARHASLVGRKSPTAGKLRGLFMKPRARRWANRKFAGNLPDS